MISNAGLLIVGHGSTVNADSSSPTWSHAAEIRRRGVFRDVRCAFWKEEPSLRDALFAFDPDEIANIAVVPNFISEGYFTQTVIPRELELSGPSTRRANGQIWHYAPPVGNHAGMTGLLLQRAADIAPGIDPSQTSLLIVGHGTALNENSSAAAKREVEKIRQLGRFAVVHNVYMEEPPLVSDWEKITSSPNVVVVPFFIADGLHSYEDIPRLLGIVGEHDPAGSGQEDGGVFRGNPYTLYGRSLFYAPSIGTDPRLSDIIVAQAKSMIGTFENNSGVTTFPVEVS
ncbi:MAG: CbiX/SirB N-terminal domain-containing protein [Chthoniobacterales bacterium]